MSYSRDFKVSLLFLLLVEESSIYYFLLSVIRKYCFLTLLRTTNRYKKHVLYTLQFRNNRHYEESISKRDKITAREY